jgi:D-alanyl-D-alanine dipeptidase
MYSQIEITLQGVQQALQSSQGISTKPLPEGTTKEGDETVQLRKIADTVEVRLRRAQEEKAQATQALKKAQEEIIEQRQAVQQEKNALQEKLIEEAVNRAFLSVTILEKKAEEPIEHQVMKLDEVIQ